MIPRVSWRTLVRWLLNRRTTSVNPDRIEWMTSGLRIWLQYLWPLLVTLLGAAVGLLLWVVL
jgi:hypothetical protein